MRQPRSWVWRAQQVVLTGMAAGGSAAMEMGLLADVAGQVLWGLVRSVVKTARRKVTCGGAGMRKSLRHDNVQQMVERASG